MSDPVDHPGCAHQVHQRMRGGPSGDRNTEPTNVCSSPGGLVHMHDCPVMNGMECRFFNASETPDESLEFREFEEVHGRLMDDFLSRVYQHRVRNLRPDGSEWERRREEILERYAVEVDMEAPDDLTPEEEAAYAEEKERLIAQRKRREEARKEQEAKTREDRARDRAKMGIKTVVEKAQETVAVRGNVSESIVDDMPSAPSKKKRRRRRRSGASEGPKPAASGGAPSPSGDAPAKKKRRRRRRRRKPSEGGGGGGGESA